MNKMQRSLKRLFCLLLSAILLIGIAVPASADTVTYNYKVKANTTLNVRSDPSTDYASIGSISGNTRICVTETVFAGGRNWGKITYKGRDAWVCIDYCDKIDDRPVNPEIPSEMKVDWTVIDISKFQRPEYFDWNALNNDAVCGSYTPEQLVDNIMKDAVNYDDVVILMHDMDARHCTVESLQQLIDELRGAGYTLLPIDENTPLIRHR